MKYMLMDGQSTMNEQTTKWRTAEHNAFTTWRWWWRHSKTIIISRQVQLSKV